jgi:hypothetical protein
MTSLVYEWWWSAACAPHRIRGSGSKLMVIESSLEGLIMNDDVVLTIIYAASSYLYYCGPALPMLKTERQGIFLPVEALS